MNENALHRNAQGGPSLAVPLGRPGSSLGKRDINSTLKPVVRIAAAAAIDPGNEVLNSTLNPVVPIAAAAIDPGNEVDEVNEIADNNKEYSSESEVSDNGYDSGSSSDLEPFDPIPIKKKKIGEEYTSLKYGIYFDLSTQSASRLHHQNQCYLDYVGNEKDEEITIRHFICDKYDNNQGNGLRLLKDTINALRKELKYQFTIIILIPSSLMSEKDRNGLTDEDLLKLYTSLTFTSAAEAPYWEGNPDNIIIAIDEKLAEYERKREYERKKRENDALRRERIKKKYPTMGEGGSKKKTKTKTKKRRQRKTKTKRKQSGNKRRQTKKRGKR